MPKKQWTMGQREQLSAPLEHFLVEGCYWSDPASSTGSGFSFDGFLLAGEITRRDVDRLRTLWLAHGAAVPVQSGRPAFAETVLAGGTPPWPGTPWRCLEHPDRRPGAA
jgi:hypothetical protein